MAMTAPMRHLRVSDLHAVDIDPAANFPLTVVSRAFQVLTDPDKKAKFDRFGGDPDNRFSGASASSPFSGFARSPTGGGGGASMFEEEISPEEMFRQFFGGGGGMGAFGPGFGM